MTATGRNNGLVGYSEGADDFQQKFLKPITYGQGRSFPRMGVVFLGMWGVPRLLIECLLVSLRYTPAPSGSRRHRLLRTVRNNRHMSSENICTELLINQPLNDKLR